jgi:hypothetical protein
MIIYERVARQLELDHSRKSGLHPTIANLSNLSYNLSNIEEWSICWTCSSITIRLTFFFVSFGQYEHIFCVTKCVGLPTKTLFGTDV